MQVPSRRSPQVIVLWGVTDRRIRLELSGSLRCRRCTTKMKRWWRRLLRLWAVSYCRPGRPVRSAYSRSHVDSTHLPARSATHLSALHYSPHRTEPTGSTSVFIASLETGYWQVLNTVYVDMMSRWRGYVQRWTTSSEKNIRKKRDKLSKQYRRFIDILTSASDEFNYCSDGKCQQRREMAG